MNDSRFPWVLLVPRRAGAAEIIDLEKGDRALLFEEITAVSAALKAATACDKLNVAALGNQVRQLHVHIVARFTGDSAWPGPIWGESAPVAYEPSHARVARREDAPGAGGLGDVPSVRSPPALRRQRGLRLRRQPDRPAKRASPARGAGDRARATPSARLYLFCGDQILLRGSDPLFTVDEAGRFGAAIGEAVLLGWRGPSPRLTATLPPDAAIDESQLTRIDLRSLATSAIVSAEDLGALAQAQGLVNWHARHRFCSTCGHASVIANGGLRRDCPNCGAQHFPRTDPVVIMLVVDLAGDRALLARQTRFPPGMYSALAGFMEPGETVEQAVRRETMEEAGIRVGRVGYYASQPWPFPTSLMIGCHAEALSREDRSGRKRAGSGPLVFARRDGDASVWRAPGRVQGAQPGCHRPPPHRRLG